MPKVCHKPGQRRRMRQAQPQQGLGQQDQSVQVERAGPAVRRPGDN